LEVELAEFKLKLEGSNTEAKLNKKQKKQKQKPNFDQDWL